MWAVLLLMLVIPSPAKFTPLAQNKDLSVTILREGDQPPWIRAEHTIPVPAQTIYALLIQYEKYPQIFGDAVETAKVLAKTPKSTRLHLVWPLPFPMDDRDAIVKYEHAPKDNGFLLHWYHDHREGDPTAGLRIEKVRGMTELIPEGSHTRIVYTYYADLGGDLPNFIKEASYTGEPEIYFNSIRKALNLPAAASL